MVHFRATVTSYYRTLIRNPVRAGSRTHRSTATEEAETATKLSPTPFQKHSLGGCDADIGSPGWAGLSEPLGGMDNASLAVLGSQVCRVFWTGSHAVSTFPGPGRQVSPLLVCPRACARCPFSLSTESDSDRHIDCYVSRSVVISLIAYHR